MMRKIVVAFSILATLLVFNGCSDSKEYILVDNVDEYNKQIALEKYNVTFLFEVEGVKLYRFIDCGNTRYFSIGNSAVFSTESQYNPFTKTSEEIDVSVIEPAIGK
jgi:hypothetical protein